LCGAFPYLIESPLHPRIEVHNRSAFGGSVGFAAFEGKGLYRAVNILPIQNCGREIEQLFPVAVFELLANLVFARLDLQLCHQPSGLNHPALAEFFHRIETLGRGEVAVNLRLNV
jgi:hypothetical protein